MTADVIGCGGRTHRQYGRKHAGVVQHGAVVTHSDESSRLRLRGSRAIRRAAGTRLHAVYKVAVVLVVVHTEGADQI
jgi:hypothetical protein